jgi:hypothetical protein
VNDHTQDYVITVTTRDDDHALEPRISAVVRLDEKSVPYIVELTVRPADRGETLSHAVRDIDFEQLTKALLSTVSASARVAPVPTARHQDKPPQPRRTDKPAQSRGNNNQRPYRKMPPAEDVKAVFLETESVGKLASHFDVPRYTAQAWVDRLRRRGQLEPPVAS